MITDNSRDKSHAILGERQPPTHCPHVQFEDFSDSTADISEGRSRK